MENMIYLVDFQNQKERGSIVRNIKFFALIAAFVLAAPAAAQDLDTAPSHLVNLEQRILATAEENPGEYGIAAMDLATGQLVGVNTDIAFPMASTMKIAVAAAYLSDVDRGTRSLSDTIGRTSAYDLMDRMIVRSDNHATDVLIARLGGPEAIHAWLQENNLGNIRVDRTIAQLLASRRNLWENEDTSTPRAMLELLQRIDGDDLLSPTSRATLLDMMRRCKTGKNRIKGLMPAGTLVEHKTGTLNGYTSDVGFLTLPTGQRIAVVFFARGGENRPAVIATAARAIHDGFSQNLNAQYEIGSN